jgi:hypothetical protein
MSEPVIDGTADEVGTDLVVATSPGTLFRTDDPVQVLERATAIAEALKKVLVDKGMIKRIGQSEHVKVEGWQTLGAMVGVVPVITWTRKIDRGWEARCEARTLDERVVGAGEAECLKDEDNWKDSDDFAIRSMAQTRATSKALSGPLRFVVTLAGYAATPAEEMDGVKGRGAKPPSEKQIGFLRNILDGKARGVERPSKEQLGVILLRLGIGIPVEEGWTGKLNRAEVSKLLDALTKEPLPSTEYPSDVPGAAPGEFEHPEDDGRGTPMELHG